MPFKSKAQARKFFVMAREGDISKKTLNKFVKETPSIKALPEKVTKHAFVLGIEKEALNMNKEHKNPKGGLSAKGRADYNKAHGTNLKPGVKGEANTPEKMRRKGSWAVRFYGQNPLPPLKKPNGEPTRLALTAAAWGEKVPTTEAEARAIAAKGRELLAKYKASKEKKNK